MDPHHAHNHHAAQQQLSQIHPSPNSVPLQQPQSVSAAGSPSASATAKRGPGRPIATTDNHDLQLKREQARDRQRRKRARDKLAAMEREVVPMETGGSGDGIMKGDNGNGNGKADGGGEGGSGNGNGNGNGNHGTVAGVSNEAMMTRVLALALADGMDMEGMAPDKRRRIEAGLSAGSDTPISLAQLVIEQQHQRQQQPQQQQHDRLSSSTPINNAPAAKRPRLHHSMSQSESSMSGGARPSSLLVDVPEPPAPPTEEELKRERVKKAARERQRKHRAMMKAKRMSQADDEIDEARSGNAGPSSSTVLYAHMHPHAAGQQTYLTDEQMMYQDHVVAAMRAQAQMDAALAVAASSASPNNHDTDEAAQYEDTQPQERPPRLVAPRAPPAAIPAPPPLPLPSLQSHPPPHETQGQAFAKTMFLALACAPMLKPHMMRTLHMTEADFPAVEQVVASAWDHWDHIRRITAQVQAPPLQPPAHQPTLGPTGAQHAPPPEVRPPPAVPGPSSVQPSPADYFRERFQRTLSQPSPYQQQQQQQQPPPSSLLTTVAGPSISADGDPAPATGVKSPTRRLSSSGKRKHKSIGVKSSHTKPRRSKAAPSGGDDMMNGDLDNNREASSSAQASVLPDYPTSLGS
ncbi:hypothetical protein FRB96_003802 [Tulasnella sp. 330]|nr:hypothetical protein FRB96_003802 [Tulasnella sp. 330]